MSEQVKRNLQRNMMPFMGEHPLPPARPTDRWTPWSGQDDALAKSAPMNRSIVDITFQNEEDRQFDRDVGEVLGTGIGSIPGLAIALPLAAFGPLGIAAAGVTTAVGGALGSKLGGKYGFIGGMHKINKGLTTEDGWSGLQDIGRGAPGY